MKKTLILLMIGIFGQSYAQVNTSLLQLKNTNGSQMNGVANPLDGSVLFGTADSSLFQRDSDEWIQLRQKLRVCNDQLSILNGNSVSLTNFLPIRTGETMSWDGDKWKSDSLLSILDRYGEHTNYVHNGGVLTHSFINNALDIIIDDDIGYITSYSGGLEIFDASDLNNLSHISGIQGVSSPQSATFFGANEIEKVNDDYLLVNVHSYLHVIDISDISNPSIVHTVNLGNAVGFGNMSYHNGFVYLHDGITGLNGRIKTYTLDLSGPSLTLFNDIPAPNVYYTFTSYPPSTGEMLVHGEYLVTFRENSDVQDDHLAFYDISNPSAPSFIGTHSMSGIKSITAHNNHLFISYLKNNVEDYLGGIKTIRLSDLSVVSDISPNNTSASVFYDNASTSLRVFENRLFVYSALGSGTYFPLLRCFDITDPANPTIIFEQVFQSTAMTSARKYILTPTHLVLLSSSNVKTYEKVNREHGICINTKNILNSLDVNGNTSKQGGGNWLGYSDKRLKKNIKPYTKGLDVIRNINPYQFNYRSNSSYSDTTSTFTGVLAQEMQYILPESVQTVKNGKGELKNTLQFDSSSILYNLINALQEIKKEQDLIEHKINTQ
ncbi:MAG: tail fiber domain-containing protein [Flavobacteriales bacterium]|nr:tail fiber domain-containing protein [Flavobacteriales bacterium]